jgi:hypothetical protein
MSPGAAYKGNPRCHAQKPITAASRGAFHPDCRGALQQESDRDADMIGAPVFESHDGAKEFPMGRNLIAVGKRDHQAHPHRIMRHGRGEIQAITREINHLTDVLDLSETGVERPDMQR